jgi:hypothetical protein
MTLLHQRVTSVLSHLFPYLPVKLHFVFQEILGVLRYLRILSIQLLSFHKRPSHMRMFSQYFLFPSLDLGCCCFISLSYKWASMSTVWAHAELTYECMKMPVLIPKGLVLARFGPGIAFTSATHFTPNGYNSWIILDLLASMYVVNISVLSFHKILRRRRRFHIIKCWLCSIYFTLLWPLKSILSARLFLFSFS